MRTVVIALIGLLALTTASVACPTETFVTVSTDDSKTLRDMLEDAAADPFDQFAAYDRLSCSDNPPVRKLAAELGLAAADPTLRSYVMLDILLSKTRIDITVDPSDEKVARALEGGTTLYLEVGPVYREEGCIVIGNFNSGCAKAKRKVLIEGDTVLVIYANWNGKFKLGEDAALVGTLDYAGFPTSNAYVELL